MEVIIILIVLTAVLVVFFIRGMLDEKNKERDLRRKIHESFGQKSLRKIEDNDKKTVSGMFREYLNKGKIDRNAVIDEITWNDLAMDAVFDRINHTFSSSGQEYLYYILHVVDHVRENGEKMETEIAWFFSHEREREELQYLFSRLGKSGDYSIHDYLLFLDHYQKRNSVLTLLADLLLLAGIGLLPFYTTQAFVGLFLVITFQMFAYVKQKHEIEPYLVTCAYVKRILDFSVKIRKIPVPVLENEWKELEEMSRRFGKFRLGFLMGMRNGGMTGDPLSLVMDYVNMLFHLDILAARTMLDEIRRHLPELDRMIELCGRMDAEMAIASFRASLEDGWCVPELGTDKKILTEGCYHPLLTAPVKNSIRAEQGVLVTGSNASGKSTFLRTVAVNAVLAQTIHTCAAERYHAPIFRIYSSMSLSDSLESGESYYMAEIKAMKRIMDGLHPGKEPVLCFVDEVLRGTNTIERIAASVQILKKLNQSNSICFAATHDIELTELLNEQYDNYHFEENIVENQIRFDYKLRQGMAATRNAIRLLGLIGYDEDIIREADKMAEYYLQNGRWKGIVD